MIKGHVVIVDDEKNTCDGLNKYLSIHGYKVKSFFSAEEALPYIEGESADVVLTDLRLGSGMSGLDLLDKIISLSVSRSVIVMTAYGTVENAVVAMQKGAYHYVTKPINLDELLLVIKKAISRKKLEDENRELKKRLSNQFQQSFLIGSSVAFKKIYDEALQVASSNASVLIQGESGTGKEVIAELIHEHSKRKQDPFLQVHCAALSENLLESELFGHERGAFTGASQRKIGRFEKAHGGTIFLDEIAEIDHKVQVKLLRVLQNGSFERVGGTETIHSDVRIIAATNKNLAEEVKNGNFREDLFYRINVISLEVPALRERTEDIPALFDFYVNKFAAENRKPVEKIDSQVYEYLCNYSWPGNIRELKNIAERVIVLLKNSVICEYDLPHDIRGANESSRESVVGISKNATKIADFQRELIQQTLIRLKGNKSRAARELGLSRRTLYRKISEYGLD